MVVPTGDLETGITLFVKNRTNRKKSRSFQFDHLREKIRTDRSGQIEKRVRNDGAIWKFQDKIWSTDVSS
jgi:hypothetical protein